MSFPALSSITRKLFDLPDYAQRENNICSMVNFFPEAKRLLEAIEVERIVEIGSEAGLNTAVLLDYVKRRGKQLITVDPAAVPFPFSPAMEPAFFFYQESSAEFLQRNIPFEVMFMDGDHNYETVLADLKTIHETRKERHVKLLFLHDVGWPWARQDIYYDPSRIAHPHPFHAENRVSPYAEAEAPSLSPANYMTADAAGGPANGVLTAVEDFLTQYGASWYFQRIPVLYGIGILISLDGITDEERQKLLPLVEELASHCELLSILELNRIENLCQYDTLQQVLKKAGETWCNDQNYIKSVNAILPKLTSGLQAQKTTIESLQQTLAEKKELSLAIDRKNQELQTAQQDLASTRLQLWNQAKELRQQQLRLSAEAWRSHQGFWASLAAYPWRNAGKLKRIQKALETGTVKLLSLDIFDTLLFREFHSELQRFAEIAKILHARHPEIREKDLYYARALAHQMAYQTCPVVEGCREASANDVFRIMAKILGREESLIAELSEAELDYETCHLHLNPGIWKLVQLAQARNIPVIAVSDMYWGRSQLQKLLAALLPVPNAIKKIYSSCDYGVSKLSGILFDRVAQEEGVNFPEILHIGDNRQADFYVPFVRCGLTAYWLPRSKIYTVFCHNQQAREKRKLQKGNILHGV